MLMSIKSYAHQPELSSSVLSTTKTGTHILQIASSLNAFEEEINYTYAKDAYKTPDEFKNLVSKHFKNNVLFIVNATDTLEFGKAKVILGHETKLIVEVLNIPPNIKSFFYKNTMFRDMPHNKMKVILLTEGLPKEEFILKNKNNQTIQVELKNQKWNRIETNNTKQSMTDDTSSSFNLWISSKQNLYTLLIVPFILITIYTGFRIKNKI
jgi:hypothetical protein